MRIGIAARAGLSTALAMTLMFAAPQAAHAGKANGCFYKGIYLAGKVQVVNNFPGAM